MLPLVDCRFFWGCGLASGPPLAAEPQSRIVLTSGCGQNVRQVAVRFNVPMVPFGDPRLVEALRYRVPRVRYRPLGGCAYWVSTSARSAGRHFLQLSPESRPQGDEWRFGHRPARILSLHHRWPGDPPQTPVRRQSDRRTAGLYPWPGCGRRIPIPCLQNTWCEIEGVQEKVGVRLLGAGERRQLFEHRRDLFDRLVRALVIPKRDAAIVGALDTRAVLKGSEIEKMVTLPEGSPPIVVLACQRQLPSKRRRCDWCGGRVFRTQSGIATTTDQALAYRVRPVFEARFHCDRVNADAACIPVLPMVLQFSAPVLREIAEQIVLEGADGKRYRPVKHEKPERHGGQRPDVHGSVPGEGRVSHSRCRPASRRCRAHGGESGAVSARCPDR